MLAITPGEEKARPVDGDHAMVAQGGDDVGGRRRRRRRGGSEEAMVMRKMVFEVRIVAESWVLVVEQVR
jgi:hypothetical protein